MNFKSRQERIAAVITLFKVINTDTAHFRETDPDRVLSVIDQILDDEAAQAVENYRNSLRRNNAPRF